MISSKSIYLGLLSLTLRFLWLEHFIDESLLLRPSSWSKPYLTSWKLSFELNSKLLVDIRLLLSLVPIDCLSFLVGKKLLTLLVESFGLKLLCLEYLGEALFLDTIEAMSKEKGFSFALLFFYSHSSMSNVPVII